ncbi:MAG: bifunctional 3,4-dihydroxy-2-butanone-4-phosphate synthase/GTP cyclohydrolase II [bacterium]
MSVSVSEAIEVFKTGGMLILVDDEERENEGDFILAAEFVTPEAVNFMSKHGRGLICLATTLERLDELDLGPMVVNNSSKLGTNFTVSVDARRGTSTGISAADRCRTVKVLIDPKSHPSDLMRPGHLFPLGALPGGVLQRAGHTEGSVDLARLAGLFPAAILCEIMSDDGSMARLGDLEALSHQHKIPLVTIRDLIAYRVQKEKLVHRVVTTKLPNEFGLWQLHLYENTVTGETHVALVMGDPTKHESVLVRVHSQCFTGDTLGSLRCDCNAQLQAAMKRIADEGVGVLVYMHQEGRGIGLKNKLLAYALQDQGKDTVEANEALGFKADLREYGIGAQILADIGLTNIRLMTNNPRKIVGLSAYHLRVVDRVPLEVGSGKLNEAYLEVKRAKLGHLLTKAAKKE